MRLPPDVLTAALLGQIPRPTSSDPQLAPQDNPAASASPAPQDTPPSASESDNSKLFDLLARTQHVPPEKLALPMRELRPELGLGEALDYLVECSRRNAKGGADFTMSLTLEQAELIEKGLRIAVPMLLRNLLPAVQVTAMVCAALRRNA